MLCYTAHCGKLLTSTWALNINLLYKSALAPDRWAEENSSYASVMIRIKGSQVMEPHVSYSLNSLVEDLNSVTWMVIEPNYLITVSR